MTEEFLAGWQAARVQYQNTGGVQPFPPGYEKPVEEEKPAPVKKATRKPKEA